MKPFIAHFMEREMSVEYADNKKQWGIVDFLVAQGKHSPKEPFFLSMNIKSSLTHQTTHLGSYWRKWWLRKL